MRDSAAVRRFPAWRDPERSRRLLAVASALAVVLAATVLVATGWIVTDRLEQDDDFCNACHLPDGAPLHIRLRRDFDGRPPVTLASQHAGQRVSSRADDPAFRCIDCHGGVGLVGRARVKALAARDTVVWLTGHFEEPRGMRHPLRDGDCLQCHPSFEEKQTGFGDPAFHDLSVHNVELGVACVECHLSHVRDGNEDAFFLHAASVRRQCARCHSAFSEELEEDLQ